MKILHVSDLHNHLNWFDWLIENEKNYDVTVIAGDLLDMLSNEVPLKAQIKTISKKLRTLNNPTLICSGNHDGVALEQEPDENSTSNFPKQTHWFLTLQKPNLIIKTQPIEIQDFTFQILHWEHNREIINENKKTIVISHNPPKYTKISNNKQPGSEDYGDIEFLENIKRNQPLLTLSGHIHDPINWYTYVGNTLCLNPTYTHSNKIPNRIEIDTNKKIITQISSNQLNKIPFRALLPH
jgi:Icc-related predicted phosphoesterase